MKVINERGDLVHTLAAIETGTLRISFIGGSVTSPTGAKSWPEPVIAWFLKRYPGLRLHVENSAIGATGSDLAVFRAERDVLQRDCDLVFIEFSMNDFFEPVEKRARSREGLIRKILKGGTADVVIIHTFMQDIYDDMVHNRVPDSIQEFEVLAEHYRLSSVWMGLHALNALKAGQIRWEEWLPDGIHPDSRGSLLYAESVIQYLTTALDKKGCVTPALPAPLNAKNCVNARLLPFERVTLQGPWTIRRGTRMPWIERTLTTAAVGAKLSFEFEGEGAIVFFDFGKASSEFRWRLDGGDWQDVVRNRPAWCGASGWIRPFVIAEDLKNVRHSVDIEVTHGNRPECTGTNFDLAFIGVIAP